MAVKSNIVLDQGSDFIVTISVKNLNENIVDLTGYTGEAQIRKYFTSSTFYSFDVNIVPQFGEVSLSMSANTSESITPGRYLYDCELTSPSGIKNRIVQGIVTITPQVTK